MKDLFISLAFGITLASASGMEVYRPEPVLSSQISHNVRVSLRRCMGSPMVQQVSEILSDYERKATPCQMIFDLITSCISPFKDEVRASTKQAEVYEKYQRQMMSRIRRLMFGRRTFRIS